MNSNSHILASYSTVLLHERLFSPYVFVLVSLNLSRAGRCGEYYSIMYPTNVIPCFPFSIREELLGGHREGWTTQGMYWLK